MRIRSFLTALLCILSVPAFQGTVLAQHAPSWGGSVRDLLGVGIPGVEVLAVPAGRSSDGLSTRMFRTDGQGKFQLSGLRPGPYLLALNKPGYEILLAQVNTHWVSHLTLTLIPGNPSIDSQSNSQRNSMDWVLRAPRSDVLKKMGRGETVAVLPEPPAEPRKGEHRSPLHESAPSSRAGMPFSGDVEQWFTADPSFGGGSPDVASSSGRTTALKLDGDLFGRGIWRVGGVLGTLTTPGSYGRTTEGGQEEGAGRLRVAMDYDVSTEDSVRLRARYDRDSFRGGSPSDPLIPAAQEVRTLGYQAGWSRKMEQGRGLEMRVGFTQALGRIPGANPEPDSWKEQDGLLQDRRWEAGALYDFNLSPEHRVQVRAATRLYSYEHRDEGWILAPMQPELSMAESGQRGWSVSLHGEDAWQISNPLSLTLGLDYHRAQSVSGFSAIVPRIGARRESDRLLVQGEILVRLDSQDPTEREGLSWPAASSQAESPFGYQAEVLRRLGGSWKVSGHAERNPLGVDESDGWIEPGRPADAAGFLLTDPAAVTDEIGVQVSKRLKGVEGSLATDQGKVRGRVAPRLDGAPIQMLDQGEIRYITWKAVASVPRTDTEVRLDYRRLQGLDTVEGSGDPYQASRLDLTLLQQVPFLGKRLPADWRVLVAYQTLIRNSGEAADPEGAPLPGRVRRLSGGIGVRF